MARPTFTRPKLPWTKRGKRLRASRPVAEAVAAYLRSLGKEADLELLRLWSCWADVLGPGLAEIARPLGHRGSALLLGMEDPIVAQELTFFAPQILERVNAALGRPAFDKVLFELLQGRFPLDVPRIPTQAPPPQAPRRPPDLGTSQTLLDMLDTDTPQARAYRAYLRMFTRS